MKSRKVIRRKELAATISLLLAAYPAAYLQAQNTDQDDSTDAASDEMVTEEVIVTGIRRSLMNSIDIKESNTSIVEAISAEEIGKLPDISITDSLARLPGVTAQRLNGRSQVLSVRGLGPDFTTALLNGRPQVSSGDNRGVEFDQYPSEMISQAIVYKTPDATLMGQGLAGTVDMQTIRPLAYGKQAFVANARYVWNDISALNDDAPDDGWRGSFTYVDQFMDDTLGIAFGIAHADTPTQSERFNAWGYPTGGPEELGCPCALIGGAKPFAQSNNLERTGIIGTLEWAPSDTFRTSLDLYYTDFQEKQVLRGIELPLAWSAAVLQPEVTIDNGLVTSGTFNEVKGVMRNDLNNRDSELIAGGWNMQFDLSESWIVTTDLSYSKMERQDILLETYSGTGGPGEGATDNLGFQMRDGQGALFSSILDYTDPNLIFLSSPQGWGGDIVPGGQQGYNNSPTIDDELTALDVRAEYVMEEGSWLSSIEFGVNYQTREKTKIADEYFLGLAGGASTAPLPTPTGFTNLSFIGIDGMITYDPLQAISDGTYVLTRNPNADVVIKSWTVEEDLTTAFAMLNFDFDVGSTMIYGNFGVQYVNTDQSSVALSASGIGSDLETVPNYGGDDYSEWLPSFNLTWDVGSNNLFRFAYARTLARARMDQMRASLEWGFDSSKNDSTDINNSPWSGSGGNPALRPWLADAFDLSYEKYLEDGLGYLAVAVFYKDLDTWVDESPEVFDFTGYPTGGFDPFLDEGLVSIPQNLGGGDISGFEISGSLDFGIFTPALEGLGLIASASFTSSDVTNAAGDEITLPGLSEDVYNLTAYYENDHFSIRASGRQRSEFLGEVSGFGAGREFRTVAEETVWDAQASYFFGGSATGLNLLFQVYNLTDEAFTTFANDDSRQVIDYQSYGRTYLVGASYAW
jgi:iron complex outermembrane receptor protein